MMDVQPIVMSYAQHAGLANPRCQLYMLFYYIGPASVAFSLHCGRRSHTQERRSTVTTAAAASGAMQEATCTTHEEGDFATHNNNLPQRNTVSYGATATPIAPHSSVNHNNNVDAGHEQGDPERAWPSRSLLVRASGIAAFDIFAQSMTYTGE